MLITVLCKISNLNSHTFKRFVLHCRGKAALWCFSYQENKSKNHLGNVSFLLNSWFKLPRRLIEHFVCKAKKKKSFKAFVCVGLLFIKSDFLALYHPWIHFVLILFLLDGFRRNDCLYLSFKSISDRLRLNWPLNPCLSTVYTVYCRLLACILSVPGGSACLSLCVRVDPAH